MRNYKKHAVIAAALCAVGVNAATLTWTGGAGDDNWTTAGNWTSDSETINFAALDNSYYFCDVPNNTTINITSDLNIANLTLTNTTGAACSLKFTSTNNIRNTSTGTFFIAPNCTLDFNCPAPNPWGATYNGMILKGGGTLRVTKTRETWGGSYSVYGTTLSIEVTGGFTSGFGAFTLALKDKDAVLSIACDTYVRGLSIAEGAKVLLNGHKLINNITGNQNSISGNILGDANSQLSLSGPCDWKFAVDQTMNGTYHIRNAKLHLGTDASHIASIPSDSIVSFSSFGILYLYGDTQIGLLSGDCAPAYVRVYDNSTFTLNGLSTPSNTTFASRLNGTGDFVKKGANYNLTMTGNSYNFSGDTKVEEGTLELSRPIERSDDIVGYWPFDGDDYLADKVAGVTWKRYNKEGYVLPEKEDGSGVFGDSAFFTTNKAVRGFIDFDNVAAYQQWYRGVDKTNFTVSVWLRPANTNRNANGHFFNFGGWPGVDGSEVRQKLCLLQFYKVGATERLRDYSENFSFTLKKSIVDGQWHHVVYVHELHRIQVYLDGVRYADKTFSDDMYVNTRSMQIGGKDGWGIGYCGGMDELILANGSWDEERVLNEYKRVRRVAPPKPLPQPAARWTFDKDLIDEIGGVELVNKGTKAVAPASRTGNYGKSINLTDVNSWLEIKDGNPYPFPSGNQKFTISLRYQYNNAYEYSHTFSIGDTSTANKFFGIGRITSVRNPSINWSTVRGKTCNINMTGQGYSGVDSVVNWDHIVCTYDGTTVRAYREGKLYGSAAANLDLTPGLFNFGHYPEQVENHPLAGTFVDDFRVWTNCCLSADQVAMLARSLEKGDDCGQLTNSAVTVSSGASLKASGTGNAVKSLGGNGAVEIALDSSLIAAGGTFSGTLLGHGRLTLTSDADFSAADASGFDGYIEVKGGEAKFNSTFAQGRVELSGGVVKDAANDVVIVKGATISHNGATPTVPTITTTGKLTLPDDLTIKFFEDVAPYGEVIVATAGELVMPASTDGWNIPTGYTVRIKDNKLRLLSKLGGVILLR